MQCPFCGFRESKVVDSRHTDPNTIRRRRECEECKKRFTTYEKIETSIQDIQIQIQLEEEENVKSVRRDLLHMKK